MRFYLVIIAICSLMGMNFSYSMQDAAKEFFHGIGSLASDIDRAARTSENLSKEDKAEYEKWGLGIGQKMTEGLTSMATGMMGAAEEERKGKEERKRIFAESKAQTEKIKETMSHFAKTFLDDRQRLTQLGAAIVGTAAGVYFFRNVFPILRKMVENRIFTPPLIDETSVGYMYFWPFIKNKGSDAPILKELHFDKKLQNRINQIIKSYKRTARKGGYYLNYLLYGEPGTGKTASARAIARESGMDYAIMSGGNVQKLLKSGKAEEKLKEVFSWANSSKKGLILFIDEADAFLKDPTVGSGISEELYSVLNSYLNLTGTESKKISIILSTNHPQNLPKAVRDRVGPGQYIYFGLPGLDQRTKIITQLIPKYFDTEKHLFTPDLISSIAHKTEGFSGRNLSYLLLSLSQHDIFEGNQINYEEVNQIVDEAVEQNKQSAVFRAFA